MQRALRGEIKYDDAVVEVPERLRNQARAFDPQPQHLDEDAGQRSLLGGLAASGWQVCAIGMRLFADGLILKSANKGGSRVQECRWIKPVKPGDRLRLDAHVVEAAGTAPASE